MLGLQPVRAQVLQIVGDGPRLGVVVQVLGTRAVLKCQVTAGNRAFAGTLRHKQKQIVFLRVVSYKPPELTVELEADTVAAVCADTCCGELAGEVEPVERRRAFLAPLCAETC